MDLLEHQGKAFLAAAGVPVPPGQVASTVEEAVAAAGRIGYPAVVKAQVPTGGRGKAGGIKLAADEAELARHAKSVLGMDIKGFEVHQVLVEAACAPVSESYTSVTFDRETRRHLVLLSGAGGVDIEEVAASRPEAIARAHVDPLSSLSLPEALALVAEARLEGPADDLAATLVTLFDAYVAGDAQLVEVNPLGVTAEGRVLALDAKVSLDESASFRHPEGQEWRTVLGSDPREVRAAERGLNYVGLDGTVGVIGNGAGLVMATLDVVEQAGGRAANFLDVGGGAGADVMAAALEVVTADPAVRSVLVNIFGGITRCDQVAEGIVSVLRDRPPAVPVVVRLDGTNATQGREVLAANPSASMVMAETMMEAAQRAVELAEPAP